MLPFVYKNFDSQNDEKTNVDNLNVNIAHDSLMLNITISLLGLFLTIIYYNNFHYSSDFNFSTLIIAAVMIILTTADIIVGSVKYHKNGWKVLTILTSVISGLIAILLLLIVGALATEILNVDTNLDIIFTQDKQLSSLNNIFKKTGFMNINDYVKLYPLAYFVQSLANTFKGILKRHKTHKNKNC